MLDFENDLSESDMKLKSFIKVNGTTCTVQCTCGMPLIKKEYHN